MQNDDITHKLYDATEGNLQYHCLVSLLASILSSAKEGQVGR